VRSAHLRLACPVALLLLGGAVPLVAQSGADSARRSAVVRSIQVETRNVFSTNEASGFVPRLVNKLHFTTRPGIVRRELLFRRGEPYDSARVAETARNLRSLQIFRDVRIDSVRTDSGLALRVITADGWSTRPDFRFKSTGGSVVYTLSLDEGNLFGTATHAGVRYRKTPDRSNIITTFQRQRLVAGKIGLAAQYEDRSDGRAGFAQIARPFFSLESKSSWSLTGDARQERILRFFGGSDVAGDTLQHRYTNLNAAVAWAPRATSRRYFRWGVMAQLRREDFAQESRVDTISKSVTGAVGGFVSWRRAHFLVSRGFQGFGRQEDIDVSTVVGAGLNLTPTLFGYREQGVVPYLTVKTGFALPRGFAQLNLAALGRITETGVVDSGSVHLGGHVVLQPTARQLAVFYAAHGWQKNPLPGAVFDLGLGIGPRAFRQHSFTGDRAFFTSAEYRYTVSDEFLKLTGIGVAAFLDYGGAWYSGARRRTGWDYGIGLRLGATRATDLEVNRIDLAYRVGNDVQRGGWVLVVAKGFAFSTTGRLDY